MPITIRYWTSHPEKSPDYWRSWFGLTEEYVFELDETNPEYLFATEHIYSDSKQFRLFLKLRAEKRISIFVSGEAITPDLNLFDYACSYDLHLSYGDRITRKPPVLFFKNHIFTPLTTGCSDPEAELGRKTGFCNFIYSNPKAHPRRDQIFTLLSQYKHIDSLGPHLNNCQNQTSRGNVNWRELLVSMKRPYKFSIAVENASFEGYTTEKLISSFQAHTVPIYWGNPLVAEEFNPAAFINANGMSDEEIIDAVRTVDGDDRIWQRMVSCPAITAEQNAKLNVRIGEFKEFFSKVFDQRLAVDKKRAPVGYWNSVYEQSVRCGCSVKDCIRSRLGSLLG